jgi:transcriptional regulator with XRE-family HTH domain
MDPGPPLTEDDGPHLGAAGAARSLDSLDIELGRRLRSKRRASGLSLATLGAGVGLSGHQIHKYERGFNRISVSTLVRMCRILGCRLSDIVVETETLEAGSAAFDRAEPKGWPPGTAPS